MTQTWRNSDPNPVITPRPKPDLDDSSATPARRLAVLSCMDCRLNLHRVLDMKIGDAHILRNAGGRVTDDVLRSLIVSQQLLRTTTIIVIHHTGCGLAIQHDPEAHDRLQAAIDFGITGMDSYAFDNLEASVRADVQTLASNRAIAAGTLIIGAIYDTQTHRIDEIAGICKT